MGYVLLAVSIALSYAACARAAIFFEGWYSKRPDWPTDLADLPVTDWPGLVSLLLPRKARAVWHGVWVYGCILLLGVPHGFMIHAVFTGGDLDLAGFGQYLGTLALWLGAVVLVVAVATGQRTARARARAAQPTPGAASG